MLCWAGGDYEAGLLGGFLSVPTYCITDRIAHISHISVSPAIFIMLYTYVVHDTPKVRYATLQMDHFTYCISFQDTDQAIYIDKVALDHAVEVRERYGAILVRISMLENAPNDKHACVLPTNPKDQRVEIITIDVNPDGIPEGPTYLPYPPLGPLSCHPYLSLL